MKVLLTGGTGFIGSHAAVALALAGHEPVLLDNFANSRRDTSKRIARIIGHPVRLIEADVRDVGNIARVLREEDIESVIHFAALKSVAESSDKPLNYFGNNVGGLISLLEAMDLAGVRSIVFSSSATVYGEPQRLPIDEAHPRSVINPYGRTKLICEEILADLAKSSGSWRVSMLRYFNPVGAHPSALIGEDPTGVPNNLMPVLVQVALRRKSRLLVFGGDYPTNDGSAVRDYIHVMDLADGHIAALEALAQGDNFQVYNLGTGRGTSVLELIRAFETTIGEPIPYDVAPRRVGDISVVYADAGKADRELNWKATRSVREMCDDTWRFATRGSNACASTDDER